MLWTHIIWEVLGHSDYAIFGNARTPSGHRGESCEVLAATICQQASILQCKDRPV